MLTRHSCITGDARDPALYTAESVDLILTSPPYPMIRMWDELFTRLAPDIGTALRALDGAAAFERMHQELDFVWTHAARALKPGGFLAINVGDATRTIDKKFQLYSNHARIIRACQELGLTSLPNILWRKPTNAPTKFLGSGMLPAGAYVTLEHEYILLFRKGPRREFRTAAEKVARLESALFWEERNLWFSDIWTDVRGQRQSLTPAGGGRRERSAAFPLELASRLVNMFSLRGDTVLDPFLGTGTTLRAALMGARNSVGIEIEKSFIDDIKSTVTAEIAGLNAQVRARLNAHEDFVRQRTAAARAPGHFNATLNLPVMTTQERLLGLYEIESVESTPTGFTARHRPLQWPA